MKKFSLCLKKRQLLKFDLHCLLFPENRVLSIQYRQFSWGWLKLHFFSGSRSLCDLYFRLFIWKTVSPIHLKACPPSDWKFPWEISLKCHFLNYICHKIETILLWPSYYINPDFFCAPTRPLWFLIQGGHSKEVTPGRKQNFKKWSKTKRAN